MGGGCNDESNNGSGESPSKTHHHFVLIHGASHGAWCWYKLQSLIRNSGHKVTCVDLKSSGVDQSDPNQVLTLDHYNQPLIALISSLPPDQKVVLVGHSAGGLSVTDMIHRFAEKIHMAVYVAANMLKCGFVTEQDVKDAAPDLSKYGDVNEVTYGLGPDQPPTSVIIKPEFQREILYNTSPIEREREMKVERESGWGEIHYVVVHGAGHGGWCWYKVKTLLEAEGHKVTTVDLTSAGIDSTPFYEVLSFSQYNRPLTALMESLPTDEKIVLVGHSLGGLNITDVLYKFPDNVLVAVYIAAAMVKEGQISLSVLLSSPNTVTDTQIRIAEWDMVYGPEPNKLPGIIAKPEYQRSMFYNMSPVEDSTLAGTLLRPCPVNPLENVPLIPTEGGLRVPRVFVRTLKDQLMAQSSQDDMIAKWPPSKVYALGSDHSPFLSTPSQLARVLVEVAIFAQNGLLV